MNSRHVGHITPDKLLERFVSSVHDRLKYVIQNCAVGNWLIYITHLGVSVMVTAKRARVITRNSVTAILVPINGSQVFTQIPVMIDDDIDNFILVTLPMQLFFGVLDESQRIIMILMLPTKYPRFFRMDIARFNRVHRNAFLATHQSSVDILYRTCSQTLPSTGLFQQVVEVRKGQVATSYNLMTFSSYETFCKSR